MDFDTVVVKFKGEYSNCSVYFVLVLMKKIMIEDLTMDTAGLTNILIIMMTTCTSEKMTFRAKISA